MIIETFRNIPHVDCALTLPTQIEDKTNNEHLPASTTHKSKGLITMPDNSSGFIMLPRDLFLGGLLRPCNPLMTNVFVNLLVEANWRDDTKSGIRRGEAFTTLGQLADWSTFYVGARKERPSEKQIQTALKNSENAGLINRRRSGRGMTVTVNNFHWYQGTPGTTKGTPKGTPKDTEEDPQETSVTISGDDFYTANDESVPRHERHAVGTIEGHADKRRNKKNPPLSPRRGRWRELLAEHEEAVANLKIPERLDTPEFRVAWNDYAEMRIDKHNPLNSSRIRILFDQFEGYSSTIIAEALRTAYVNRWMDIPLPRRNGGANPLEVVL